MNNIVDNKKKNHKLMGNILLLCFVLLVLFISFEIILRIFSYPIYGFQENVFVKDDVVGYKLSSDYQGTQSVYGRTFELETNSKGLRDSREYDYQKKKPRIIILGDSFAFGNGVNLEESYPEHLRNLFGDGVEIINLGVPGYGINNQYLSYINEGKRYDPDIVLISYINNDWNVHQVLFKNDKIVIDNNHSSPINKKGLIAEINGLSLRALHLSLLFNFRSYSFIYTNSRSLLSKIINRYWANTQVTPYFWNKDSHEYRVAYNGYYFILEMLKENTNSKIIIFMGPTLDDLFSSEDIKKVYNLDYEVKPDQTKDSVEEIAELLDIEVIRIDSNDSSIYLEVDGHWNDKGNKLMAEELYKRLETLLR